MRTRLVIATVVMTAAVAGCGESLEGKFGDELFRAACARCHDDDGSGGIGPAIGTPDSNAAQELTDEQIHGVIRVGPGRMPAFKSLTEEQVDSVIAYLRELQGE